MNLVNSLGGGEFWAEQGYVFDHDFQRHLTRIMGQQPDARPKAFGVVPVAYVSQAS